MTHLTTKILPTLETVDSTAWDNLVGSASPFLEYGFLRGLETSGCLKPRSGWTPHIVVARDAESDADGIVGAVPLYIKDNSEGEFVFDWSWAEAAMRAGLDYYPKAVAAVPFTPVTGARILVAPDRDDHEKIAKKLVEATLTVADELDLSSVHFNFIPQSQRSLFEDFGLPIRWGMQYHWTNDDGTDSAGQYRDFDHFLSRFRSKRRANIRRERRKLAESGVTTRIVTGGDVTDADLGRIFRYYLDTVQKHFYGRQYLTEEFFLTVGQTLTDRLHLVFAEDDQGPFAGAFNLFKGDRLYGRYWGCEQDIPYAHFETCMYRPIQWCIDHGVRVFEPGAGGEHKFDRGFLPTPTFSAHYIRDPRLRRAVTQFVDHERHQVQRTIHHLTHEATPFKH